MALYSAGEVGIDVLPVLDKFYAQLRAGMARVNGKNLTVDVGFNPNTALYDKTASSIDGRTFTNTVKFVNDDSGIKKIDQNIKKLQDSFSDLTFTPKIDTAGFYKTIDTLVSDGQKKMSKLYNQTISGPQNANDRYVNDIIGKYAKLYELSAKRKDLEKEYAKALSEEDTKAIKKYAAAITKIDESANKAHNTLRKLHNLASDPNFLDASKFTAFRESVANSTPFVTKMVDSMKAADLQAKKLAKDNSFETEFFNEFTKVMKNGSYATDSAAISLAKARQNAKEYRNQLQEATDTLSEYQNAFKKFQPFGGDFGVSRELDSLIVRARELRNELGKNPNFDIDISQFEESYAHVLRDAENMRDELQKKNDIKVRVDFLENNAERLEDRLERLKHQRIDIPADIQLDEERFIKKLRETAELVKKDPSRQWETTMNLDVDMRAAERRLKDFQKEHDKLDMDLDLQTRLAQAHLAWFTRPRTVDIYADFKGTDLGKIINGMTSKATGIGYVNNQFQKLVNTMDSLDTIIPKWSLLGSTVLSLGAGMTNLAATVGGVGESLVMMSSAALAAPAALTGLVSVLVAGRYAFQTAKENFDSTTTSLNGLGDAVGNAAWEQFGDELYNLANNIAPTLKDGLTGVATAEGSVLSNLLQIIGSTGKTSELANIFANTSVAVRDLDPGLQNLVSSFMTLGDATSQYLPRMASYISDVSSDFADWVRQSERTGEITDSLEKAIEQGGYLVDIFGSFKGILSGTFGTLSQYENGLQGFSEAVASVDKAVNSVKFQDTFNELITGAQNAQQTVRDSLSGVGDDIWSLRDAFRNGFEDAGTIVASVLSNVTEMLADSDQGIMDFTDGLASGWSKAMDAVGDSGPVFSSILSSVGQLAETFGGTFASGLRVIGPLMSEIADSASFVAEKFDALPEPIKQAITLYATFGKAAKTALDTVKMSMLNNIIQTASYSRALNDLGLSSGKVGTGFKDIAKSWMAVNGASIVPTLSKTDAGLTSVDSSLKSTSKSASAFSTVLGGLKSFGVEAGWTIGFTVLATAVSDFIARSQETEQAAKDIGSALSDMSTLASDAAKGVDDVGNSIKESLKAGDFGESGLNWLSDWRTGFDNVSDAAKVTGISVDDLTDAVTGGSASYDIMQKKLSALVEENTTFVGSQSGAASVMNDTAKAAMKQSQALEDARNAYKSQVEDLAVANGYTKKYADSLLDAGEDSTSLAIALGSASDRMKMLSNAQQIATNYMNDQRQAQENLLDVSSRYGQVYSGIGDTVNRVNQLVSEGQTVWDDTATGIDGVSGSFNIMSEAGRTAQSALSQLGTSGHDLLQAMVDAGASTEEVKAKQQELADQFLKTAQDTQVPAKAAEELQKIYGLTPEEVDTMFKVKTDEAKSTLTDYLSNLRALYPGEGNTATFTTILNAINSGAITGIQEVQDALDDMSQNSDDYTIVLSADNQQVKVKTDYAVEYCKKNAQGEYVSTLTAQDLASITVGQVAQAIEDVPTVWDSYLEAKTSGKSDVDALNEAIQNVPVLWDAYQKAHTEGKSEVDALTDAINAIPESKDVYQNAITSGQNQVDALRRAIDALYNKTVTVTYQETHIRVGSRVATPLTNATGGRIKGPGSGTSDSILSWVSNGEYVLRAKTVKQLDALYGNGFLDYVNKMGKLPKKRVNAGVTRERASYAYANGGRIPSKNILDNMHLTVNVPDSGKIPSRDVNVTQNINIPNSNPDYITRIVGERMLKYVRSH